MSRSQQPLTFPILLQLITVHCVNGVQQKRGDSFPSRYLTSLLVKTLPPQIPQRKRIPRKVTHRHKKKPACFTGLNQRGSV